MKLKRESPAGKQGINLSELARQHGVSRQALREWKNGGLDLSNPAAIAARISASRSPAAVAGKASDGGEPYAAAKARRERALADKAELEVAHRRGELLELALAEGAFSALGAVFRQTLVRMPGELPDQLDGCPPPAMQSRLRDYVDKLFCALDEQLKAEFSKLQSR